MRKQIAAVGSLLLMLALSALAAAAEAPGGAGKLSVAVFAGGCFWCVEEAFEEVPGVARAVSGYTGGTTVNPTYAEVSGHGTGHFEAVQVTFDPAKVSYARLLDWFWRNIDPLEPLRPTAPLRVVLVFEGVLLGVALVVFLRRVERPGR